VTTIRQLTDAALAEVAGYSSTQDVTTALASPISADDLTITVSSAANFSRGWVQIGDELLLADSVNKSANTITLLSTAARGVQGTTATSHALGDTVTMAPTIPRMAAVRAVEDTIRSSSGLFGVGSTTLSYDTNITGYTIPSTAEDILDVSWFPPGPLEQWLVVRRWRFDRYNHQVILGEALTRGAPVKVSYSIPPVVPTADQEFSVTGLPDSCMDVIRLGAAWRMSSLLEPRSLTPQSAEARAMTRGAGTNRARLSQYLYSAYRQRLDDEIRNLQDRYPIRVHWH
jgi:hypothetical protein